MQKVFLFITLILFALQIFAQETEPKVVKAFAPEKYPPAALAVRASGEVKVQVEVDNNGIVVSAKTTGGHPLLQPISINTAKKWKFSSQTDSTNSRHVTLTFNFDYVTKADKIIDKGVTGKEFSYVSSFVRPYQMNFTQIETPLIPIIELLPRTDGKLEDKYCELHKVKMETEIVDADCHLLHQTKGFFEAKRKLFPNINYIVYGVCDLPTQKQEVYYCDKCRKAHDNWKRKNTKVANK
jgi:TonB family protein